MSELLDKITKAVERTAGGTVTHRDSVPIIETFRGETVWAGIVEVFDVAKPPPTVAYGWAVEGMEEQQYVTVLGVTPVDSPLSAVRAWLVGQARQ
jgi:hypothetical protein